MLRESCASSACFSARVCSAIARDCSPRAIAMRPCKRQSVDRREGGICSRSASGGLPSAAAACARSSCRSQASARLERIESSSCRDCEPERRACARSCAASAPRPRSSAALARANVDWMVAVTTCRVYKTAPTLLPDPIEITRSTRPAVRATHTARQAQPLGDEEGGTGCFR